LAPTKLPHDVALAIDLDYSIVELVCYQGIAGRTTKITHRLGQTGMYGPPPFCKRKMRKTE